MSCSPYIYEILAYISRAAFFASIKHIPKTYYRPLYVFCLLILRHALMTAERKKRSGKHIYFKIRSVLGVSRVNLCHSEPQGGLFEKNNKTRRLKKSF